MPDTTGLFRCCSPGSLEPEGKARENAAKKDGGCEQLQDTAYRGDLLGTAFGSVDSEPIGPQNEPKLTSIIGILRSGRA